MIFKSFSINDAYRENNFIDYKVNFALLVDKSNKKEKQRRSFCSGLHIW
ncbi:hypothetical protein BRYFOR_07723 [Marvinbryantia formatexigens DSM 14469]|uniref:Uncharacterized protein n=1 Tax=Marvinbryantia formatexigens DSM 14469 TaxID=478749 RepID=C6LGG3_9FIRM|nr:hypothetical protein BRYFOR_07723 [Marvinbryantia formatexigens DSM 14469]